MNTFLQELWKRITSDSPSFFVKIRNLGLSLVGVGTSLLTIPQVPPSLAAYADKAILVGSVMAAISQLTVKEPVQK